MSGLLSDKAQVISTNMNTAKQSVSVAVSSARDLQNPEER